MATPYNTDERSIRHDDFQMHSGYRLEDYLEHWDNPYGPGEMAFTDTRAFRDGVFIVSATPFRTGADLGTLDHMKYFAVGRKQFEMPETGSIAFEATLEARTPGTVAGRIVHGVYGPAGAYPQGAPFAAALREGQQACATLHLVDIETGQLFDWLVSETRAMSLIERLPSSVTRSSTPAGREQIYTQIIREHPIEPGPHAYGITFWRNAHEAGVDYSIDGEVVDRVTRVGVPLDRQDAAYTGSWPSLGAGEPLGQRIRSLSVAHGLFSLLDAFPFQHEEAPELSVSIPISERLFGQGAEGRFSNFVVTVRRD